MSILGDSISTYIGYIPEGYAAYYPAGDIDDVSKTWWMKVINKTGMTLLKNASWSGSRLAGNTLDTSGYVGCSMSRIEQLKDGENMPDYIIMWIGINDWGSSNRNSGEFQQDIPKETTIEDITKAYYLACVRILENYPNSKLLVCTIPDVDTYNYNDVTREYPQQNEIGNTIYKINLQIKNIALAVGASILDLHSLSGLNFWNIKTYTIDGLHFKNNGTDIISDYITNYLLKS